MPPAIPGINQLSANVRQNVPADMPRSRPQFLPTRPRPTPEFNLLAGACSSEVAKATLEKTFDRLSSLQKLLLSQQFGYESFSSMLAASTVATLSDGSSWWLTTDRYGAWTAWNLCHLDFPSSAGRDSNKVLPRKPR
jgi:hypothetical protein